MLYDRQIETEGQDMPARTYKLIELVGVSDVGTDDAIKNAITRASESLKGLDWFQVTETRGHVVDGKVIHFQVTMKIGFTLEDSSAEGSSNG